LIQTTLTLSLPPEKRAELLGIICSIAERVRVKRGCIACYVSQDVKDTEMIRYEELWERQEDMERHLRSDDYRTILFAMEMSSHAPDVRFSNIEETTGMETIERVRQEGMCRGK
jgi:quinol monooxygenase YgiN